MNAEILIPALGALAAVIGAFSVYRAVRSVEKREDKRDQETVIRHFIATAPKKHLPKAEH